MSTWKTSKSGIQEGIADTKALSGAGGEPPTNIREIQSLAIDSSIEIDANSYDGGDPYNRTGQHLVEHLRKLESNG